MRPRAFPVGGASDDLIIIIVWVEHIGGLKRLCACDEFKPVEIETCQLCCLPVLLYVGCKTHIGIDKVIKIGIKVCGDTGRDMPLNRCCIDERIPIEKISNSIVDLFLVIYRELSRKGGYVLGRCSSYHRLEDSRSARHAMWFCRSM